MNNIHIIYKKNIHRVQYSTSLYLLRVYRTKCRLIKRGKSLFILSANAPLENVRKKTATRQIEPYEVFCATLYLLRAGITRAISPNVTQSISIYESGAHP